jgi:hypothetical protein
MTSIYQVTPHTQENPINIYGSLSRANIYFDDRLNSEVWENSIAASRHKSLIMATRIIDRLNFEGQKFDEEQPLQFPRGNETTVPLDIEYAAYEIAIILLDGFDLEQELNNANVTSDAFSGVRTTYSDSSYREHIIAGIPSVIAWNYLKPYLRDPRQVNLSRVN